MTTGEKIRKIRKEKKMTQQQLANVTGIERSSISKYEKSIISPAAFKLNKIAEALEVDIKVLLSDDEPKKVYSAADLFVGVGLDLKQEKKEYTIDDYYNRLNKRGQRKAIAYVKDLSENPKYRNKK